MAWGIGFLVYAAASAYSRPLALAYLLVLAAAFAVGRSLPKWAGEVVWLIVVSVVAIVGTWIALVGLPVNSNLVGCALALALAASSAMASEAFRLCTPRFRFEPTPAVCS